MKNNLSTCVDYIMSFFERMNCGAGQGLYLLRTMSAVAQRDGKSQEDLQVLYRIVHLLYCNEYLDESNGFYKLTETGYQYTQGAKDLPFESHLELVVDFDRDKARYFQQLWWMIGKEEKAPFYVSGPMFYNTINPYLSLEPSYSIFLKQRAEDKQSTSRVAWYSELIQKLPKDKWQPFLKDLSRNIDEEYNKSNSIPVTSDSVIINPFISEDEIKDASKKKVFISYVHDKKQDPWVNQLAKDLSDNFKVAIDTQWPLGREITRLMEEAVRECDKVLLILTPAYKEKADKRLTGAGYETALITSELYRDTNKIKFIPIVREGDFTTSYPSYLGSRNGLDMTDNVDYAEALKKLKYNLMQY